MSKKAVKDKRSRIRLHYITFFVWEAKEMLKNYKINKNSFAFYIIGDVKCCGSIAKF